MTAAGPHRQRRRPPGPPQAAAAPGRSGSGRAPRGRGRLGEWPFRADQLSRQYFTRLADDPAAMTDLPQATREQLTSALLPGC